MKNNKNKPDGPLGPLGEQMAMRHLIEQGYLILEQNWRFKHKEIDLIARNNKDIVFVEVKSRTDNFTEELHEAVSLKKQRNIVEAAEAYIMEKDIQLNARFDLLCVVFKEKNHTIEHIIEAFHSKIK